MTEAANDRFGTEALDAILEEDQAATYAEMQAKVGEPEEVEPWVGIGWIALAIIGAWTVIGVFIAGVAWIGMFVFDLIQAAWGML